MVEETLGGDVEDAVLQFLQVAHTHHFLHGLGVAEDEIAEAEVLPYRFA